MLGVSYEHRRGVLRCSLALITLLAVTVLIACADTASKAPVVTETPTLPVSATSTPSSATAIPVMPATPTLPTSTEVPAVVATPTPFSVTAVPVVPVTPTPCELALTPSVRTPVPDWFGVPTPTAFPRATGSRDSYRSTCRPNVGGSTEYFEGEPGFHFLKTIFAEHFVKWTADGSRIIFGYDGAIWSVDATGSGPQIVADANPGYRPHGYPALPFGLYADISIKGCRIVYSTCEFIPEHPLFSRYAFELLGDSEKHDPVVFHYELATARIDGSDLRRLTENEWIDHFPTWSPDGTRIAFIADTQGGRECSGSKQLYTMKNDGSDIQLLTPTYQIIGVTLAPPQWSPNGRRLAFIMDEDGGEGDCRLRQRGLYAVKTDRKEFKRLGTMLSINSAPVTPPAWSPDGNRIAFVGSERGGAGIYTVRFDGTELVRIPSHGSLGVVKQLAWSPDGSELLFVSNGVWVANADGSGVHRISHMGGKVAWSPDGSRIAVYVPHSLTYPEAMERGEFPYSEGDFGNLGQLYTMARDGSDSVALLE